MFRQSAKDCETIESILEKKQKMDELLTLTQLANIVHTSLLSDVKECLHNNKDFMLDVIKMNDARTFFLHLK